MCSFGSRDTRLVRTLAFVLAGAAIAAPSAQAEKFIPGITDFPSRVQEMPEFRPGITDFPSRLGAKREQAERANIARSEPSASRSPSHAIGDDDFGWGAAGIGAGFGAAATLLGFVALSRRPRARLARSEHATT